MITPDFFNPKQDFKGTSGLILFGEGTDRALSYFRDGNTGSYPYHVDFAGGVREDGESPYDCLRRETSQEFGIDIAGARYEYSALYPSLADKNMLGWFVVARVREELAAEIVFGEEGLCAQVTPLEELYGHLMLIPRRKEQIEAYAASLGLLRIAA